MKGGQRVRPLVLTDCTWETVRARLAETLTACSIDDINRSTEKLTEYFRWEYGTPQQGR